MMLTQAAHDMLTRQLIPFWSGLRDNTYGGFYGLLDFDLNLHPDAEKGCILNSRILWFFSRCAAQLGDERCRKNASHAYHFLVEHCLDREYGGVYWSLTHGGKPLDTTKHTYNQAFAIYALSAYYALTGERQALDTAEGLFKLIEDRCRDEGGYLEAFDRSFAPMENDKLSENGVMAERTMNTLLHVFEGYAGLYQASHNEAVAKAMRGILELYLTKIYDPVKRRQTVFFDLDCHSLIDLHSYGHDIESSWLMDWGASLLGDVQLTERVARVDSALTETIYRRALNNGSLLNECERGVNDTTRVWWVQAEGVLGFLNEWEKSGDVRYRDAALSLWRYINRALVDPRPGSEWYWEVDADGVPFSRRPIVEPWKCPYHNGRMCLEILRRNFDVPC